MNASIISALAALVGAAIGGLTSVLASWLTQQTQAKAQWIAQERIHRQELYRDFIEQASNFPSSRPRAHPSTLHEFSGPCIANAALRH